MTIEEITPNWFRTGRILACEIDGCINNSVGYVQLNPEDADDDGQIVWLCQPHFSGVLRKEIAIVAHINGPLFDAAA